MEPDDQGDRAQGGVSRNATAGIECRSFFHRPPRHAGPRGKGSNLVERQIEICLSCAGGLCSGAASEKFDQGRNSICNCTKLGRWRRAIHGTACPRDRKLLPAPALRLQSAPRWRNQRRGAIRIYVQTDMRSDLSGKASKIEQGSLRPKMRVRVTYRCLSPARQTTLDIARFYRTATPIRL